MGSTPCFAYYAANVFQRKSLEAYGKMFRTDNVDTLVGPPAFAPSAELLMEILLRRIDHRGGR